MENFWIIAMVALTPLAVMILMTAMKGVQKVNRRLDD